MSEIKKEKWIKCNERLPDLEGADEYKISGRVLGFGSEGAHRFETYQIVRLHGDNKFYTDEDVCMQITHWMPLPEKPEEYKR